MYRGGGVGDAIARGGPTILAFDRSVFIRWRVPLFAEAKGPSIYRCFMKIRSRRRDTRAEFKVVRRRREGGKGVRRNGQVVGSVCWVLLARFSRQVRKETCSAFDFRVERGLSA